MVEPGLDLHDWESEWASLEEDLAEDPADALPLVRDLVGRMLRERELLDGSQVGTTGTDPELLRSWESAKEIADRVAAGEDVDPGDVGQAVENFRWLYGTVVALRDAP